MGLFEKLLSIPALGPYLEQDDQVFVEDQGWRVLLQKVRQLKEMPTLMRILGEASPLDEKQKIIRGYLFTMAAEAAGGPMELPCVDYAGCYLSRGELKLKNPSSESLPSYIGMGMQASSPECRILVEGDVGDYLAYRAARASVEVRGSARDRVGMAVGEGFIRVEGDVAGGLGGNTHNTRLEVDGSVGRIQRDNSGCKILVGGDVHWSIGDNQLDCFIKVCGNVGMKYRQSGKLVDMAAGLGRNSVLLVGGDVWGNIGTRMEIARVLVWGKVHGEIHVADNQGGFIYLNKKSTPFYKRMARSVGGDIGVKYVILKDSGYLFAEDPEDIKELIL
jgi:formylmethanofuran dehydrogenase subunit C